MDEETPWILKMISEHKVSARSASRILRALDLLNEAENQQAEGSSAAVPLNAEQPEESRQIAVTEDETAIWAQVEETAREMREAEAQLKESQQIAVTEDEVSSLDKDETAIWAQVEETAREMREAEAQLETELVEAEAEKKNAIVQEADLLAEQLEAVEAEEEENEEAASEIKSDVMDEDQMEEEAAEELPESVISGDLEPIQESQHPVEESVKEPEETPPQDTAAVVVDNSLLTTRKTEREEEQSSLAEESTAKDILATVVEEEPLLTQETERETEAEPQFAEETAAHDVVWTEISDKLVEDDGACVIVGIPDGTGMVMEKTAGNAVIRGWDQPHVRIENDEDSFTVLQAENTLKIKSESDIVLYVPSSIGRIIIDGDSDSIDIKKYSNDIVVNSGAGDVNIKGADGTVKITSTEGNITLGGCRGKTSLKSLSGDITVRSATAIQIENADGLINLGESLGGFDKSENRFSGIIADMPELYIETDSGNISLAGIDSDVDAKSRDGKITIERCRGRNINLDSSGGSIELRDIANDMDLKSEDGNIFVENFLGKINVWAKNTDMAIKKSGDTEIHIESDGGNIEIEDCYADAYMNIGKGDVRVSGGNLSFGGMGKIDLKIESGNAYLRRRTFEDVRIAIGTGDAELNMEKLSLGGSGRISVYRGNITVRISPKFQCEVIAHALRKRIHIDLPVKVIEKDKNQMRGMLNGGGSKIELIAPDGEIKLQAL